ncbi:5093_t:CDS:10, partial [Diversispora eburnea]
HVPTIPVPVLPPEPVPESETYLDPRVYATLISKKIANGTKPSDECYYISTPRPHENKSVSWDCEAGYYCLSPRASSKFPCADGFYCPENTQPVYCCEGYYCQTPKTIELCPEGHFCTIGTVDPPSCNHMAYCPPGSKSANKYFIGVLIAIFVLLILILFKIKEVKDVEENKEYQKKAKSLGEPKIGDNAENERSENSGGTLNCVSETFDIKFENLSLKLPSGVEIMKGVTGKLKHGRTCAIMGPSGAGKTTLVSLLTGKARKTDGKIKVRKFIDKKKVEEKSNLDYYRKLIGFVPQEDIMLRELTIREILMHSALMRLPTKNMTPKEKEEKVMNVIKFLGLSKVMDTAIGDEVSRGISGGQRKRTNIGMELVAEPSILFLDEPTSGLDSATALDVCEKLKEIAKKQKITVAAIIHSPSLRSFKKFDDLMLLGIGGRVVYFGPRKKAMQYFYDLGFILPKDERCETKFYAKINKIYLIIDDSYRYAKDVGKEFYYFLKEFFIWEDSVRSTPNGFSSFILLFKRACLQIYRNRTRFLFDLLLHLGCGAFVSLATNDLGYIGLVPDPMCSITPFIESYSCLKPSDNLQTVGVFASLGITFCGINAGSTTFGYEKVVYWRDTSSGMKTIPYFLAKSIADIPRILLAALMFSLSFVLFFSHRARYSEIYFIMLLTYIAAWQIGYFLSAIFSKEKLGLVGTGFALLFGMVLSGATPRLDKIKDDDSLKWLYWIWSVEALYLKELDPRKWVEIHTKNLNYTYSLGDYPDTLHNIIFIALTWSCLAFLAMKLVNRDKQK